MEQSDIKRIGLSDYLSLLELWCMKEFPFNWEPAYKTRRSAALSKSSFMLREGKEAELIMEIKSKRVAMLEKIFKYDPADVLL